MMIIVIMHHHKLSIVLNMLTPRKGNGMENGMELNGMEWKTNKDKQIYK